MSPVFGWASVGYDGSLTSASFDGVTNLKFPPDWDFAFDLPFGSGLC